MLCGDVIMACGRNTCCALMDLVTHDPVAINVISLGINDSNEKDLRQATDENNKCVQECEVRVGECGDGLVSGIS